MSRFDFLYVLVSLVVAFIVTDMGTSWAALLRKRAVVQFYWAHTAWSVLIMLLVTQLWWGLWRYHTMEQWPFFSVAAIVAEMFLLVLTTSVITPPKRTDAAVDLKAFFFEVSPVFFALGAALMVVLALINVTIGDQPLLRMENVIRAVAISVAMYGAISRSTMVHSILVATGFTLLVFFIVVRVAF